GFQMQMEQFQKERLNLSYGAIGQMDRALERTTAYLHERRAFGGPLLANQYLQYTLAELIAEVESLRQVNYAAAELIVAGVDATRMATVAKLLAGKLVRRVADTCLQFHGGLGYMSEIWTTRFYRDARLTGI